MHSDDARLQGSAADDPCLVLTTAPDLEVARRLARRLVDGRLAACVNMLPGVRSIYRWKQTVEEAQEMLLVVKTVRARVPEIEALLAREHPYEVPECVVLAPEAIAESYRAWIVTETADAPAPEP